MAHPFPAVVDVAIVGSGPTGAAYARILSELRPDLTLATFEVGPVVSDPPGAHVKGIQGDVMRVDAQHRSEGPTEPAQDGRLRRAGTFLLPAGYAKEGEDGIPSAAMSSNVGGMGAHWTCACPRPGGRERIDFLPDLDELLDEAGRLLGVSTDAFNDAPFADEVRRRLSGEFDATRPPGRRVQPMPLAVSLAEDGTITWSGSDVVFGEVTRQNPRYSLHSEALVRRILLDGSRVAGILVVDTQDGSEHEVAATEVVVAGDALRTPQLLWASGIRPTALGRYLNDQSQVIHAVRLRDIEHVDVAEVDPRGHSRVVRQSGVSWVPFTDDEPFHGQVMQLDASPVPLAPGDVPEPGSIVGLGWFCAKELSAEDRVTFDDSTVDGYGMPAMQLHYLLTDSDHAALDAARAAVKRAAACLGDPLDAEPITLPLGASLHYQGTVRMGAADDATNVCDPTSRVWGFDGLRVAGNGVIPTSTACNPTLTSVAIAIAGARHIAQSVRPTELTREEARS